ncbi:MAG: T9SS type A sorting domain-containing protein [Bacteroidia bacterium]|nr:T9SS type A sorting domain-containing protein [Bacteroidia bacterium]
MKNRILLLLSLVLFSSITIGSEWLNIATPQRINEIAIIGGEYYIASSGGLIVYDPISSTKEHFFRTDGLPSSNIEDIIVDNDGNLWIGTYDNGVAFLQNDVWVSVYNPLAASANTLFTYCMEFDSDGALWVGTSNGIQKYANNNWTVETWQPAWNMTKLNNGDILAASHKPVIISNGIADTDTSCPIFAYSGSNVGQTNNGEILFSAPGIGVGLKTSAGWQVFDASNSVLSANSLTDIETADDGTIWGIVPSFGVYSFGGTFWKQEFTPNELSDLDYQTTQLLPTANDVLIGTSNSITRYDGSSFNKIDLSHHQLLSNFNELALNNNGEVVLKNGESWYQWDNPQAAITKLSNPGGIDNISGLILFENSSGAGLFDENSGEVWIDGQKTVLFDTALVDLSTYQVRSFLADENGTYWIGTLSGLYHTDGQTYSFYDDNNSVFYDPSFWALAEDRQGNIWASTPDGIGMWNGSNWTYYDADNFNLMFAAAGFDFYFDDNNDLWFGGWGTGLVHFDGTTWEAFTLQNSNIADNIVFDIESLDGDLYIATDEGLSVFDGSDFTNYTQGNSNILHNYCKQIAIDKSQNVWITHSGVGMSVFNKNGFTTGIHDPVEDILISRIYPNPALDLLTIEFETKGSYLIEIFDLQGKKIVSTLTTSASIDVRSLKTGIYFLRANNQVLKFTKY